MKRWTKAEVETLVNLEVPINVAAKFLDTTPQNILYLLDSPASKFPQKGPNGGLKLITIIHWRYQDIKGRNLDSKSAEQRLALMELDRQLKELELLEKVGQLVPLDEVISLLNTAFSNLKNLLLSLPKKVAPILLGYDKVEEMEAILETHVREALYELQSSGERIQEINSGTLSENSGGLSEPTTPPETNGSSMGRQVQETKRRGKRRARPMENREGPVSEGPNGGG